MKYVKKPVIIESERYVKPYIGNCLEFCGDAMQYDADSNEYYIKTLEGLLFIADGDYIIKGVNGEFYPCKLDIFEQTYDAVEGDRFPDATKMIEGELAEKYFEATEKYFEARKTGGSKNSIEITLDIKTDRIIDFVREINQATLDAVLEIIDQMDKENEERNGDHARWLLRTEHQDFRERVLELRREKNDGQ